MKHFQKSRVIFATETKELQSNSWSHSSSKTGSKITLKVYGPFLWSGFKWLKAAEPL